MVKTMYEDMVNNTVHFGHKTQKWDPRMKKYLYGEKNGVHVFNLEVTVKMLESACAFLAKNVAEGKTILFVSTKPQAIALIEDAAKACGMPFVVSRWIPGFLTNFPTVKTRIDYLKSLKEQEASGEFEKYTKKEVGQLKKTIEKLETSLGGVQSMTKRPDVIFVADVVKDEIVVKEANVMKTPIVGICDSNANPNPVDYPIPGNDDAVKSLKFLIGKVLEAVQSARK